MTTIQETLLLVPKLEEAIMKITETLNNENNSEGTITKTTKEQNTLLFYEDGAGNEISFIYNIETGYGFINVYDHETPFNTYGETPPQPQLPLTNLPTQYSNVLSTEELYWSWATDTPTTVYSTAATWWSPETQKWETSPEWEKETIIANSDGGLQWGIKKLLNL